MRIQRSSESEAFAAFELKAWKSKIADYERFIGPATAQSAEAVLDAAAVAAGRRVLDVCTGHGVLAAAALRRGAVVHGIDFAEEVLIAARRNAPGVEFQRGDAQKLPYPAGFFDCVVCGFGIMHVPEPDRALAEMHRVLNPGGGVALSVWEKPSTGNGFGLLMGAISTHGRLDVPLPHGPDFFQFSEVLRMSSALSESGFVGVAARAVPQEMQVARPGDFFDVLMQGTVRAKALLEAQDGRALDAIKATVEEGVKRFARNGAGYAIPMPAIVGSASKP